MRYAVPACTGVVITRADAFQYYISQPVDINDLKGLAAFVLASYEIELLK